MQDDRNVPQEGIRPPDDPRHPPQSVLRPEVRRSAVVTYVGGITVLFALIGLGMLYWATRDKDRTDPTTPQAVATVGSAAGGHRDSPGGFDPQPRPDNTRDEIEQRRDGDSQGALANVGDLLAAAPGTIAGRPVDVRDVEVESGDDRTFWIRDGDSKVAVVAPAGTDQISPGRRVDVRGMVEQDERGGVRIRARRVDLH
jgi:hypothetical protein